MTEPLLSAHELEAGYGNSQVLFGFNLTVGAGEVVSVLGRNGMGKSTFIKTVMGEIAHRSGRINFLGSEISGLPLHVIARRGIGWVPEGRRVFPSLTVWENLVATARSESNTGNPWTLARVLELFPRLEKRRQSMGNQLSGGEQQMLAIGRALMTNPTLLILDEATEGLAPLVREEIWSTIGVLKKAGQAILVIDKNIKSLLAVADRHYIVEKGRVVWSGTSAELSAQKQDLERFVGI